MDKSKEELLKEITQASFAVNDLTLYLDTHPNDMEALKMFDQCKQQRKDAMKQFTDKYEPLCIDDVEACASSWDQHNSPLPWERGLC